MNNQEYLKQESVLLEILTKKGQKPSRSDSHHNKLFSQKSFKRNRLDTRLIIRLIK